MNKLVPLLAFALLFGCTDEDPAKKKEIKHTEVEEITPIETLFNSDKFEDPKHLALLKELKICNEFQKDTSNYFEPACSPRFFRIFEMRDDATVNDAFLLQIKSKVSGVKLRRLVAFVRERGELVKVNTFIANLIGTRKSKSHYNDLILRFNDNVGGDIIF